MKIGIILSIFILFSACSSKKQPKSSVRSFGFTPEQEEQAYTAEYFAGIKEKAQSHQTIVQNTARVK